MHLVFATSIVPHGAPATGYEIANAAIIDALRRAGVRVTVLGFTWPGKVAADPANTVVLGAVDVRTDSASALQKLVWSGRSMVEGLTFSSVKVRVISPDEVRAALQTIEPFDGYVLNSVQFAGAFEAVFDGRPSIFVAHNVEHLSAEENAAAARSLLQKCLYRREARLLEDLERRLCGKAAFVFTLADEDRAALGVAAPGRSAPLPLVTPASSYPAPANRSPRYDATLIGTWTWQPNRIGLDWFLEEVSPHLPKNFRVAIAGNMPSDIRAPHPGVTFVGRVPDAIEFVLGGRVVPLISRAGSGVQLKTIETFELGLPSVATSRSLRGIGMIPANCTVADDPIEFARSLLRAAGSAGDVDPTGFRHEQRMALDRRIRLGLAALRHEDERMCA
ncbi:glycosyltransferase family 4 protein [Mesorhizobium sp. BAC0120]|uniref:glycosyltransferase n=1 Tax=Mesorhizobium sp. BAC0120 TaxID=3090670 RepID=UPI00298C4546|nr:glycosyltransferase family 4 protein [Mesorhizobium sp. BAC0120]MDW6025788.1 glycosyltransferase family 4 protein [Mesorhizobium sp. BAC0120]